MGDMDAALGEMVPRGRVGGIREGPWPTGRRVLGEVLFDGVRVCVREIERLCVCVCACVPHGSSCICSLVRIPFAYLEYLQFGPLLMSLPTRNCPCARWHGFCVAAL